MSRTYQARTCTYGSLVKVCAQSTYKQIQIMLSTDITYITLIFGQKILITLKKSRKINAVWTTLEMATTLTHIPSLAKTDARNFELSWQQTHKQTNTHTNPQTGTITIHQWYRWKAETLKVCLHFASESVTRHLADIGPLNGAEKWSRNHHENWKVVHRHT